VIPALALVRSTQAAVDRLRSTTPRSRRRAFAAKVAVVAVASACLTALATSRLTVNFTPSLPLGVYLLDPGPPTVDDIVVFNPPPDLADFIASRHYLPADVTLLKRVVALEGQSVCFDDGRFTVDGRTIASIAPTDAHGRRLAPSPFCGVVPQDLAVVATDAEHSFDSRYFGPVSVRDLTRARPLWTFGP
jgi:conjugative transfer signal peptidase TraF